MPVGAPIVYWVGNEDIDCLMTGNAIVVTTAGTFDPAWGRSNVSISTGSTTWPLTNAISNPVSFGNLSSFWVHESVYFAGNATSSGGISAALADSSGVARLLVRGTGTAGQLKLSSRNAAGTIVDFAGATTASAAYASATLSKFDLFVNYSASGQFSLYINGVLAADTGAGVNVTTDSATSLSFYYGSSPFTGAGSVERSQIIVADSDTRAAGVWLLNSSTAGNADQWTGALANVNKAVISDTTFISAASAGLIEEFKTGGIALPAGAFSVATVKMISRSLVGTTGPQHVEYVVRVGSTDYVGGSWGPPGPGTFYNDTQNYMLPNNPATGVPWTTADLTAATFNYGVESVA